MKVKSSILLSGLLSLAALIAPSAHAALLGVTQSYPDASLSGVTIIYDHNGGAGGQGRLIVVATGSTLNRAAGAGNSTTTQLYAGAGDSLPYEEMFTIDINNQTGAFISGTVSINLGNANPNAQRFSWTGTVTNFGFANDGRAFDARWTMTADTYTGLPAAFSNFVNGYLTGIQGGIILSNPIGFAVASGFNASMTGASGNFNRDWIFGSSPSAATLSAYTTGLTTPILITNGSLTADVFVPLPGAVLLFGSGLAGLVPWLRRRRPGIAVPSRMAAV